jgi:FG-GAP-like repeat/FG-GAP repeat
MWIQNFFKSLTSTPTRRPPIRRRSPASRLSIEALEDRCLPSFLPPVAYTTGPGSAVTTADLNGDGKLDLVATVNNSVNVLLGNGDGTFKAAVNYAVGVNPNSVAVGDINGKVAIVTANGGDSTVTVLLGNGDGTFGPAQNYAAGPEPGAVHVGNFDGNLDIVVTNNVANIDCAVTQLPGHGDGTFGPAQTVATYPATSTGIAVGDFNRDGKLDLAVTTDGFYYGGGSYGGFSGPAHVNLLIGNGDGSFGSGDSYSVGGSAASSVTAADLNGDGKLDLAVTDYNDNVVEVFLGNGNGTFNSLASYFRTGNYPVSVITADVDGNGKPDLIAANLADTTVSVLLNNGAGTFNSAQNFAAGSKPISVAAGDFNGDGFADLAVTNWGAGTTSVLINAKDWSAPPAQASSLVVSGFPSPTTAGVAGSFTVTAKTASGATATDYTGTVHFSSSDGKASLPADYTFTAADAGVHTFSATLKTAGTQSITATDTVTAGITGTDGGITVKPAAASKFLISAPASVRSGVAFSLTITVQDAYGNVVTGYIGRVHLTSTDNTATLPANYTFTTMDQGVHSFTGVVVRKRGTQKITVTDTLSSSLSGSVTENVLTQVIHYGRHKIHCRV